MYILFIEIIALSLIFLGFYGGIKYLNQDKKANSKNISYNPTPMEVAFLFHGIKHLLKVALINLIKNKYVLISHGHDYAKTSEKRIYIPESDYKESTYVQLYIQKVGKQNSNGSILIDRLFQNQKLNNMCLENMISANSQLVKEDLLLSQKDLENLKFTKFIGYLALGSILFYTLLYSTGFLTFMLITGIGAFSFYAFNKWINTPILTQKGILLKKQIKDNQTKIGPQHYDHHEILKYIAVTGEKGLNEHGYYYLN